MTGPAWTPWHKVVRIRDDVRSGELPLNAFAADLYDVVMGKARPMYQEPGEFFALTYPTFNLRELVKDVLLRLAGQNEKAVRQLELTYGGGKTHTLMTLYHLTSDPNSLPDLPTVEEFIQHAGTRPPQARIAVLAFDKIDSEKAGEVRAPNGEVRRLRHPWSVLAYQLAGSRGLEILHPDDLDAERASPPAESLMAELLAVPHEEGLATLVLIDEVLTYARARAGLDGDWLGRLLTFFQSLTQAATKVGSCAVVASLLASDPKMSDPLGKQIAREIYGVFKREREEGVQPVLKEDVAEVLRRRFFTPDSIRDRSVFRSHVVAALKGITELDEEARREGSAAEERFLRSYPFHPDLTDVFYTKWTNLEGFQRTRGILRTFALALREAERWDQSPLVGANVFLGEPGRGGVSEATRELTTVAATEEYEGKRQEWTGILEGELGKACGIQEKTPALRFRELEQAVFTTFLHSQPIGQKASTRDLLAMVGHTRPDRIELGKALRQWVEVSWFLDETTAQELPTTADGIVPLPGNWRLGSKPNLRQMHDEACGRIGSDAVETCVLDAIGKLKSLTAVTGPAKPRVHNLPGRPSDVEDDGVLHYVLLGPRFASEPGKPHPEAVRFLRETTGPDRPRVYQNAVVLAVPSREGLDVARSAARDYLGWEDVQTQLRRQEIEPTHRQALLSHLDAARKRLPEAIRHAYCIVVTLSEKGDIEAFKVTVDSEDLFKAIKADSRARIQDMPVNAEALLPEGPYDLWREGETSRRAHDLVAVFAQFPRLPKMLNPQPVLDTLKDGCQAGVFVLSLTRPDRSIRTWWLTTPDDLALKEPGLEVTLPASATLASLPPALLEPGRLPGLWASDTVSMREMADYFAGGRVVRVQREGYEDSLVVPRADRGVVEAALRSAVEEGRLWLTWGPASILGEAVPAGLLTDSAVLHAPPAELSAFDILPERLGQAWEGGKTTAASLLAALSERPGKALPWATVRDAIDGALRAHLVELAPGSATWPCTLAVAQAVVLRVAEAVPLRRTPSPARGFVGEAELTPNQIQDLAEVMGEVVKTVAGYRLNLRLRVECTGEPLPPRELIERLNQLLQPVGGFALRQDPGEPS